MRVLDERRQVAEPLLGREEEQEVPLCDQPSVDGHAGAERRHRPAEQHKRHGAQRGRERSSRGPRARIARRLHQ